MGDVIDSDFEYFDYECHECHFNERCFHRVVVKKGRDPDIPTDCLYYHDTGEFAQWNPTKGGLYYG